MSTEAAKHPLTFGDCLAEVRSVEQAAALTRASVVVAEPGSGYWLGQAAFFEADAAFRKHPSFPDLEAHVNREYGEFTHANLLRLRGEVCALRHCGTREVDELPVETVAALLNCPGTEVNADMPKPTEQRVDTTPTCKEPPGSSVDDAMRALPSVLNNEPAPRNFHDPMKRRGAEYTTLRLRMEAEGHKRDAAEWAIHRHVEAGRLEAKPGLDATPMVLPSDGTSQREKPIYDRKRCLLWANESLWEWWKNEQTPKVELPPEPTEYTMADILDVLRYQRESAETAHRRANRYAPQSVSAAMNRVYEDALSAPLPARLTAEKAFGIAVYRRLVREVGQVLHRQLDEEGVLYFVNEVADRHQLPSDSLLALSTDKFAELWNAPAPKQSPPTAQQGAATNKPNHTEGNTPQTGGRPKLGEGPNTTKQEKALRNVYELVRPVLKPGMGAKALKAHFSKDKDFRARVAEAGREFDDALFRAARWWINENPLDQETHSGNVS
jgi:hypothetical protein